MDDVHTEASAGTRPSGDRLEEPASSSLGLVPPPPEPEPLPPRRRPWRLAVLLVPLVLVVLLVIAWAVDTSAREVARNVRLAGVDVGGLTEDELSGRVAEVAADFGTTPVELSVDDRTYTTTADAIGLLVDEAKTAASALEAREGEVALARPFEWARSFVTTHDEPLDLRVNAEQVASTVVELQGDDRVPPTEPTVELVDGAFSVIPGEDGLGIDPAEVARRLPEAAAEREDDDPIRLTMSLVPLPPLGSEEAAREAASEAEARVANPIELRTPAGSRTVSPEVLRSWVRLTSNPDGTVVMTLDRSLVAAGLRYAFADVEGHPVNATITLEGGVPVIRPDRPGWVCCGTGAATAISATLEAGTGVVELTLVEGPAAFTAADAEAYGITQQVGGNNAWRDGAPTTAEPGFTTYHDPVGDRITNIHRIADLVRGAVIPPGGRFSINEHVGPRTAAKGFVPAGAIRDGLHVQEIGGGVSQFATTAFNAAYFAGLQIDSYQAHSEYFDRYPRGREATMGYPAPDLAFTNNTPYGILIWTSYTDSSLTVTLYSTPYATGQQTGIAETRSGRCAVVTTTRTVTFPDGKTATDQFRATYRPGEGQSC